MVDDLIMSLEGIFLSRTSGLFSVHLDWKLAYNVYLYLYVYNQTLMNCFNLKSFAVTEFSDMLAIYLCSFALYYPNSLVEGLEFQIRFLRDSKFSPPPLLLL